MRKEISIIDQEFFIGEKEIERNLDTFVVFLGERLMSDPNTGIFRSFVVTCPTCVGRATSTSDTRLHPRSKK